METKQFEVQGMTCVTCATKVAGALRTIDGVAHAEVTLDPARATITLNKAVATDRLQSAVANAGPYQLLAPGHQHEQYPPAAAPGSTEPAASFYPLLLIVGYITGVALLVQFTRGAWSWHEFMTDFMAGFFLVFSFFKLLDLRGFAETYRSYDLVAKAWRPWGFVYPFLELALGICYLIRWNPAATNSATLVLMLIGSVGVLKALLDRRSIRCACLGTAIRLPMTTVTLVEDLGMAAMALLMLLP